ncbi:TraR/DksA family transcriptional regulator [Microbacterium ulmi]|uniref:Molecular chaperone DnaK n=1 Tax=Microbacterium ulmi TaxID=179095 RepID=A0A7Y2LYN9_9MICO|nr:TraR/DksA C4-type zinc finger protein [Microbacterium ulmi]NII70792.1 RNA polymerase-binding transcription factor DksA [Microbacterium ulmi]NNH02809.1 molecular chaperone DnaK [Microbacterium ulmi]
MTTDAHRLLADLRVATLARIAQLDDEMADLRADRAIDSADDEHDPEGVTLSGEWSLLAGLRDEASRTLGEIDLALARVADGTYGTCVDCGRAIPDARLRARPTALRCVACAERAGQ